MMHTSLAHSLSRSGISRLFVFVLCVVGGAAKAEDFRAFDIEIAQPWARQPSPEETGMLVYLGLANTGSLPDRLSRVTTPLASRVEIVTPPMDDSGGKPHRATGIALPPGEVVDFSPGGRYLLLSGVHERPAEGNRFPMTLTFQRSGVVEIMVAVVGPWAEEVVGEGGREAPAPRR